MNKIISNEQKITFGGGCFWCTEALFQQLKGVFKVESGYSGGSVKNPSYNEVCNGTTGHAEVIEVTYNPDEISFEDLAKIHLTTHDPTTPNRQGADRGTQYRSIIFYRDEKEKGLAMKSIEEVQNAYENTIVTELKMFEEFYPAEAYHQDYYATDPDRPYCQVVIDPKLEKFKKLYKEKIKV